MMKRKILRKTLRSMKGGIRAQIIQGFGFRVVLDVLHDASEGSSWFRGRLDIVEVVLLASID